MTVSDLITEEEVHHILNLPDDEFYDYIGQMIEFYREHPVEAAYDILGMSLSEYQKVTLENAWFKTSVYLCQSRGSGKSFIMALISVLTAILYSHQSILMLGPSYRQSLMLYDKIINDVYNKSFSVRHEIPKNGMKKGTMDASITFFSSSAIKFLPIGDGSSIRGERATFIMLDEHAQHDETMINRVIVPMAAANLDYDPENPEDDYEAKFLYATSAYFQFNHSYKTFQNHLHRMTFDDDYYAAVVPYSLPRDAKLTNKSFIEMQRREMTNDDFEMEMNCKWISGNDSSFINIQTWDKYIRYDDGLEPLFEGRLDRDYVLFADIAREEGGDNASLKLAEIQGNKLAIVRQKALNGLSYQEIRDEIRRLLINFNVVDLWMDKLGGGTAVRDLLDEDWLDYNTGMIHPPILEKESSRSDGIKVLTLITADNAFNHRIGHLAKKHIEKGNFTFPELMDRHPDPEMEMAYLDLIAIKKEVTNIQAMPSGNFHKFVPTKGTGITRKDRWTTFCYAALYIEEELQAKEDDSLFFEIF